MWGWYCRGTEFLSHLLQHCQPWKSNLEPVLKLRISRPIISGQNYTVLLAYVHETTKILTWRGFRTPKIPCSWRERASIWRQVPFRLLKSLDWAGKEFKVKKDFQPCFVGWKAHGASWNRSAISELRRPFHSLFTQQNTGFQKSKRWLATNVSPFPQAARNFLVTKTSSSCPNFDLFGVHKPAGRSLVSTFNGIFRPHVRQPRPCLYRLRLRLLHEDACQRRTQGVLFSVVVRLKLKFLNLVLA